MHYLGVDVGATRVRALSFSRSGRLLRPAGSIRRSTFPAYRPEDEDQEGQGEARIALVARLIRQSLPGPVAVCWPGLKSPDGESIVVCRNGPVVDRLRTRLERACGRPIPPLMSDGECSGWGEEHTPRGLFRKASTAYFVGAGTGLAEALKVNGQILSPERFREIWPSAYAVHDERQRDYESLLAASSWAGRNPEEIVTILGSFLELRRQQAGRAGIRLERLVLGGHFRQLPGAGGLGPDVRLSRLSTPALAGSVARLLFAG